MVKVKNKHIDKPYLSYVHFDPFSIYQEQQQLLHIFIRRIQICFVCVEA